MFSKVARTVLLVNFLLCAFTLGWFWSFMLGVPLTYDLIYDSLGNFPEIDWVIVLVFFAFVMGAGVFTSGLRKGLILAAYNASAIVFWWFVEMGKFHTLFPDVTNELILGGSVLTGIAIVNMLGFIKESCMKWYNATALTLAVIFFALLPWQHSIAVKVSEQSHIGAEVETNFLIRPENFQLVATPESGEMMYLFQATPNDFYPAFFTFENGSWVYYWPQTGDGSYVPWKTTFDIPIRVENGNVIWGKAWVDEVGVWMDITIFNQDQLDA